LIVLFFFFFLGLGVGERSDDEEEVDDEEDELSDDEPLSSELLDDSEGVRFLDFRFDDVLLRLRLSLSVVLLEALVVLRRLPFDVVDDDDRDMTRLELDDDDFRAVSLLGGDSQQPPPPLPSDSESLLVVEVAVMERDLRVECFVRERRGESGTELSEEYRFLVCFFFLVSITLLVSE